MNFAREESQSKVPEVALLFWIIKVAATTLGETGGDAVSMSMHLGYLMGTAIFAAIFVVMLITQISSLLFTLLMGSLLLWSWSLESVSIGTVKAPKAEMFYWVTIMLSQTLGTALGDWTADTASLGYRAGTMVFSALLAGVVAVYYWTTLSRITLFWAAFILTRPLGAVVGDFLDKPLDAGGLALSRYTASAVLLVFIVACIVFLPQRAAQKAH